MRSKLAGKPHMIAVAEVLVSDYGMTQGQAVRAVNTFADRFDPHGDASYVGVPARKAARDLAIDLRSGEA